MNTLSKEITGSFFTSHSPITVNTTVETAVESRAVNDGLTSSDLANGSAVAGYDALRKHWSSLVNSDAARTLGPEHHLLYQALRGKDWRKGFTPITNPRKLDNGAFYDWGVQHALRRIHSNWAQEKLLAPFGALVDAVTLQKVRAVLPKSVSSFEVPEAYKVPAHD